jgi:hypothetical protein
MLLPPVQVVLLLLWGTWPLARSSLLIFYREMDFRIYPLTDPWPHAGHTGKGVWHMHVAR